MHAGLLSALLAALLSAAPPAAGEPVPGLLPEGEELELARRAARDGLHEVVAAWLRRLLDTRKDFPERPDTELLLAESDYRCGRRDAAGARFARLLAAQPEGRLADECALWLGRFETEHLGRHADAERRLRRLHARLRHSPGSAAELLARCRYYLALALVGRGGERDLGGYDRAVPDGRGGERVERVAGAVELLDGLIRDGTGSEAELLARAHVLRGRALLLRGRADDCFDLLQEKFLAVEGLGSGPLRAEARYWQAEARRLRGQWDVAAGLFAKSAAEAERAGFAELARQAAYGRGLALLRHGVGLGRSGLPGAGEALESALQAFGAVSGSAEPAAAARLGEGEVLYLLGRHAEALRSLAGPAAERDEAGRATPRAAEALLLGGQVLAAMGRRAEAAERLDEAARAAAVADAGGPGRELPVRVQALRGENLFRMAEAAREAGPEAARRHLAAAAEAFRLAQLPPACEFERCEARLWSARVLAAQLRLEEAERVVAELQDSMVAREALGRDRLHCLRGEFLLESARRAATSKTGGAAARVAAEQFGLARAAAPRGPMILRATLGAAEAHRLLGNESEAHGLYEEVLAHPRAADDPGRTHRAALGVAGVLRDGGWHRRAAELLRVRVLDAVPAPEPRIRAAALELLAGSLATLDDPAGSARAWGELAEVRARLRDAEGAARARLARAGQLRRTGGHALAAAELEALAAGCPEALRAQAQLQAGAAFEAAGKRREALRFYALAGPELPEAWIAAAELELRDGRFGEAELHAQAAQNAAHKAGLTAVRAELALGRAQAALGKTESAARQFRIAAAAARRHRGLPEGRSAEMDARRGLAGALSAMGRHEDAAACHLQNAYLADESKPDPALLELAAVELDRAGQARAAAEVRRLAATRAGQ